MTVRIGIIGPGGMGQAHIERITNLLSGGKVVAVSDLDVSRAKAVAEPLGATVCSDGAALIGAEEVDAIMVTSFGPAHEESVIAAIEAGRSEEHTPELQSPRYLPSFPTRRSSDLLGRRGADRCRGG